MSLKHETSFENLTFEDQFENRSFWKAIKPYLTSNGKVSNDYFILYERSEFISDEKDLAKVLNDFHINIVEQTTGETLLASLQIQNQIVVLMTSRS